MIGNTRKQFLRCFISFFLALITFSAIAQTTQENNVKRRLEKTLGNEVQILSVTKTPYSGLYEVRLSNKIIYTDKNAEYLFFGQILNAKTKENYTRDRITQISKIKFSDLPKELALKTVKGKGERVIAIFSDPNCPYCKRFERTLKEIDNVTVYTYIYGLLSDDSKTKARNIWCSPDPNQAWHEWMLNDVPPAESTDKDCNYPGEKIKELANKLGVTGVPASFFMDGSRISGAAEAADLENRFSTMK